MRALLGERLAGKQAVALERLRAQVPPRFPAFCPLSLWGSFSEWASKLTHCLTHPPSVLSHTHNARTPRRYGTASSHEAGTGPRSCSPTPRLPRPSRRRPP